MKILAHFLSLGADAIQGLFGVGLGSPPGFQKPVGSCTQRDQDYDPFHRTTAQKSEYPASRILSPARVLGGDMALENSTWNRAADGFRDDTQRIGQSGGPP